MEAAEAASLRRVCDNCKGQMAWDAAAGKRKCASCGALRDAEQVPSPQGVVYAGVVEHDLAQALASNKPKGRMGSGARQAKCGECGAVVEFPDNIQATKCEFCGSPQVLAQEARDDHYK